MEEHDGESGREGSGGADREGRKDGNGEYRTGGDGEDRKGGDGEGTIDPSQIGERDAPPVEEAPYKVIFEANRCIGAGKCAEVSANWSLDIATGIAAPEGYFFGEEDLAHNVRAAEVCPAKKDRGVIHVVDRRTNEEVAPDPHGDGTLSVDW